MERKYQNHYISIKISIFFIYRYFHDISVGAPIYCCHVIISIFSPKTLINRPRPNSHSSQPSTCLGPTHIIFSPMPAPRALHACEPSTTPMFKYTFLVLWIVDVGLQELEFLKGKGKFMRMEPWGFKPLPLGPHSPTITSWPTMLLLIKCTYYIYKSPTNTIRATMLQLINFIILIFYNFFKTIH